MSTDCIFCNPPDDRIFLRNEHAYALWDGFPVTEMHSLIIPLRHIGNYFELTQQELLACDNLLHRAKELANANDQRIEEFNIGTNIGAAAGQAVFHCHIHLIPRRPGDVADPRGGVRHVIPGKGLY